MLGILFGGGCQQSLVDHRARLVVKCFQVILHGLVEYFAERSGVIFARATYLKLRP